MNLTVTNCWRKFSRNYDKKLACLWYRHFSSKPSPQICIIGSGPAGFSIAQTLLKNHPTLKVDFYERLPVPFGLIRYGVSPDHQDVKNCINGYNKTAASERFSFYGNVDVGRDITLSELCDAYHAVVLCHGAQGEQKLEILGENFNNVLTSKQFVGWYNGVPDYQNLTIDLSGRSAVIIGVGNVALDTVRMLLKPMHMLRDTDITTESYQRLSQSSISNVHVVGRRGPLQMACTRKELSEITDLTDVTTFFENDHFTEDILAALKKKDLKRRKQQRLINYLLKVAKPIETVSTTTSNSFFVKFLRSPVEMCSQDGISVSSVKFQKYVMKGDDVFNPEIISTDEIEEVKCDLVITCIGYRNFPLDSAIVPFSNGKIIQDNGRVDGDIGLYACGWCSHGPKGVLADSGNDSLLTGSTILSDLNNLIETKKDCPGSSRILQNLNNNGVKFVTWDQWTSMDMHEIHDGEQLGKIREKIQSLDEMLSIAFKSKCV